MSEDHTTDNAACPIEGQFSDASFYSTGQIGNIGVTIINVFSSMSATFGGFIKFKITHQ